MKKLFLLSIFTTFLFSNHAAEFAKKAGYETNYKVAIKKAKEENKKVMFLLVSQYCSWCKKLESTTLIDKDINKKVHKKYIPLVLDSALNKYPEEFYSLQIPAIYFINQNNNKDYEKIVGYKTKDELLEYLK